MNCLKRAKCYTIGELCDKIHSGGTPSTRKKEEYYGGNIPWLRSGEINFNSITNTELFITELAIKESSAKWIRNKSVLIALTGATVARTCINEISLTANQSCCALETNESIINYKYLYYFLASKYFEIKGMAQGALTSLNLDLIKKITVPVPLIKVQEEIVSILDSFTNLIDALNEELSLRQKQFEYYREKLLTFEDNELIQYIKLSDIIDYEQPSQYIVSSSEYDNNYEIPVLTAGQTFILGFTNETTGVYKASKNNPTIIFDDFTTGFHWVDFDFKVKSSAMKMLRLKDNHNLLRYVFHSMALINYVPSEHSRQWISKYSQFEIPLPHIKVQEEIVKILDSFTNLIDTIKEEIALRQKQYEYYREKLLTFN